MFTRRFSVLALGALLSTGCPDPHHDHDEDPLVPGDAGVEDAAVEPDAATPLDASVEDGGSQDAGEPDAGELDGGEADGGHDGGFPEAPALRNAVDMADMELALAALKLMGSADAGGSGSCRGCHTLGRPTLSAWHNITRSMTEFCMADTELSSPEKIDELLSCVTTDPKSFSTSADYLGIYSAAAHLPWFRFAFQHRSGAGAGWQAQHQNFVATGGMPRNDERLTQAEFDVVAEWFARGIPHFQDIVPPDPGSGDCKPGLSPELLAHLEQMKTAGWRAKNRQSGLLMFGCAAGEAASACLSELPRARDTAYGASWEREGTSIRVLFDNSATPTSFWSRASADGRYMGAGGGGNALGAQIVDLQRKRVIPMTGAYDSGFFPDNHGFLVQAGKGALVCEQSLLASEPDAITGEEPECGYFGTDQIGIYQQVGKAVAGSDYWVAAGPFSGDDGGFAPVLTNPGAGFGEISEVTLTPMLNDGSKFTAGKSTAFNVPDQGDAMLSPSGELLVTRVKGEERKTPEGWFESVQNGYAIHKITTTRTPGGLSASLKRVGTVCLEGGKALLSFDERFMVLHRYVEKEDAVELGFESASDPAFAPFLELGGANLYLVDLLTGQQKRITHVKPGQYALFPHFRSDGWIYFVVRTTTAEEYFAASDAALVAEGAP